MTISEAISFIEPAVQQSAGTWADIGAGTGIFSQALQQILTTGTVYALDKNPHSLYTMRPVVSRVPLEIIEGDFNRPMDLPQVDGILMANSLHYAADHQQVLERVLNYLKPGGQFLLIEYETNQPLPPWIPNPLPLQRYQDLSDQLGMADTKMISQRSSLYSHSHMYLASSIKPKD